MATAITLNQMLKRPTVLGVYSRVKESGTFFQRFFQLGPQFASRWWNMGSVNTAAYDIFDHSATMAQPRAPKVGPAKIARKPIGQAFATTCRFYEALTIDFEDVYGTRPLGGQFGGPLDERGQSYIANQLMYQAERQANSMEFMISRMFRGGFSITMGSENFTLGELGGGTIDVTFPIPAVNKNQLDMGTGTNIIDASWATASTKILNHLWAINKAAERQTGYPIKHLFMNSTTWTYIYNNTQVGAIRGTAMPVFGNWTRQRTPTTGADRDSGFTFTLPAAPGFLFHVYDAVSVVATQTDPEVRTTSNTSLYIPDNVVIMTPDPGVGTWYGGATKEEVIKETDDSAPRTITGMETWNYGTNDPPGQEMRMINNFCPILLVPYATIYATVAGF